MSAHAASYSEYAANPLDVVEQIVAANDWICDRRSDSEMAAEAPGRWCDYGLYFSWSLALSRPLQALVMTSTSAPQAPSLTASHDLSL